MITETSGEVGGLALGLAPAARVSSSGWRPEREEAGRVVENGPLASPDPVRGACPDLLLVGLGGGFGCGLASSRTAVIAPVQDLYAAISPTAARWSAVIA